MHSPCHAAIQPSSQLQGKARKVLKSSSCLLSLYLPGHKHFTLVQPCSTVIVVVIILVIQKVMVIPMAIFTVIVIIIVMVIVIIMTRIIMIIMVIVKTKVKVIIILIVMVVIDGHHDGQGKTWHDNTMYFQLNSAESSSISAILTYFLTY